MTQRCGKIRLLYRFVNETVFVCVVELFVDGVYTSADSHLAQNPSFIPGMVMILSIVIFVNKLIYPDNCN